MAEACGHYLEAVEAWISTRQNRDLAWRLCNTVKEERLPTFAEHDERLRWQRQALEFSKQLESCRSNVIAAGARLKGGEVAAIVREVELYVKRDDPKLISKWTELRAVLETLTAPRPHRRRPRKLLSERPLTQAETRAVRAVSECSGNISAAARSLGKDQSTVNEQLKNAEKKLGRKLWSSRKTKTKTLSVDKRGQADVAAQDD
jgi:hypothetical protein